MVKEFGHLNDDLLKVLELKYNTVYEIPSNTLMRIVTKSSNNQIVISYNPTENALEISQPYDVFNR
jgi:hypothetical protein